MTSIAPSFFFQIPGSKLHSFFHQSHGERRLLLLIPPFFFTSIRMITRFDRIETGKKIREWMDTGIRDENGGKRPYNVIAIRSLLAIIIFFSAKEDPSWKTQYWKKEYTSSFLISLFMIICSDNCRGAQKREVGEARYGCMEKLFY